MVGYAQSVNRSLSHDYTLAVSSFTPFRPHPSSLLGHTRPLVFSASSLHTWSSEAANTRHAYGRVHAQVDPQVELCILENVRNAGLW